MKKLTAILFLALMIFNLAGYRLLFYYAQQQSDKQVRLSLDNKSYNEEDLVTIKVSILLPYPPTSTSFERIDGEIIINGKIFKYVQRKVQNGELILVCLPDKNKMRLENARDDYFKQTNDFTAETGQGRNGKSMSDLSKNISPEYVSPAAHDLSAGFKTNITCSIFFQSLNLVTLPRRAPEKPPQTSANTTGLNLIALNCRIGFNSRHSNNPNKVFYATYQMVADLSTVIAERWFTQGPDRS